MRPTTKQTLWTLVDISSPLIFIYLGQLLLGKTPELPFVVLVWALLPTIAILALSVLSYVAILPVLARRILIIVVYILGMFRMAVIVLEMRVAASSALEANLLRAIVFLLPCILMTGLLALGLTTLRRSER